MSSTPSGASASRERPAAGDEPPSLGTYALLLGIAVSYTALNLLLRSVAGVVPPTVVAALRLIPLLGLAAVVVHGGPGVRPVVGRLAAAPSGWRAGLALGLGGVSTYLVGNSLFQLALGAGGVGLALPAAQAGVIWTGMLGGRLFFKEPIRVTRFAGAVVVIGGITLLSVGHGGVAATNAPPAILLGYAAGSGWVATSMVLRVAYGHGWKPFEALLVNSLVGFSVLVAVVGAVHGTAVLAIAPGLALYIVGAGVFNASAITCSALALQRVPVAVVNLFTASQVALAAAAAALLFGEPWTLPVVVGVTLVMSGIVLSQMRPRPLARPSA